MLADPCGGVVIGFFARPMRYSRNDLLFFVCSIVFLLHQYGQKQQGLIVPLLDSYLDPLLCLPIVLHLMTWEHRFVYRRRQYVMPRITILGYLVLLSLLWEFILPHWNEKMTADPWDVLCYALGAFLYDALAKPYRYPRKLKARAPSGLV